MSSTTPPSKRPNAGAPVKRNDKSSARVTRARVQAMESRATATVLEPFSVADPDAGVVTVPSGGRTAASMPRRKPAVKTYTISRALEYSFIRADLRRLIITASALFVIMIIMRFILD